MVIHAIMAAATMNAASAVSITELRTEVTAMQHSTVNADNKEQQQLKKAACKVQEARDMGTHQLKRKATNNISEIPCYK